MSMEIECMCLECGISLYLQTSSLVLGSFIEGDKRLVDNTFCSQCGGPLLAVGKAGEQRNYIVSSDHLTGLNSS
ncbi:MAG: hypothetical protein RBS57_19365 [Desulforhabdus sp.]|nr:hypothetical protein [Desulforhabdus sp.]